MYLKKISRTTTLILASGMLVLWCTVAEPRWVAHRNYDISLSRHDKIGLKVALTSDWHFTKKPWWRVMTHDRAASIINEINASHPDIILIAGDLIAEPHQKPSFKSTIEDEIADSLAKLKAPKGVYAVLGNHDNWYNHQVMKKALENRHIVVLENSAQQVPNTPIWIAGIGDALSAHANTAKTIAALPPNVSALIMMHDPVNFLELPPLKKTIAVAGHTHGGQVALPWLGPVISSSLAPRSMAYGWSSMGQNRLYVTSGLGVSILPVRLNMRPEWVTFNL